MPESKLDAYDPDLGDEFDVDQPNLAPDDQEWDGQKYIDIGLPAGLFLLYDVEHDVADGPFDGRDFVRDDETGAYYTQTEGRPFILRVIRQLEEQIWSVDGSGHVFHYTLLTA